MKILTNIMWVIVAFLALFFIVGLFSESEDATRRSVAARKKQETQDDMSGFGPGRIDKTVAIGRIKNTISIDTSGCPTLEGFEKYTMHPGAVPGCIDLDLGDKVVGPLEVQIVMIGKVDPGPFRFARIAVRGKGEVWTYYNHLTK
jgi:hypothetical protein